MERLSAQVIGFSPDIWIPAQNPCPLCSRFWSTFVFPVCTFCENFLSDDDFAGDIRHFSLSRCKNIGPLSALHTSLLHRHRAKRVFPLLAAQPSASRPLLKPALLCSFSGHTSFLQISCCHGQPANYPQKRFFLLLTSPEFPRSLLV